MMCETRKDEREREQLEEGILRGIKYLIFDLKYLKKS